MSTATAIPPEEQLRYPVGRFQKPDTVSSDDRARSIQNIEQLPAQIRAAAAGLTDQQLDTRYRPGGWTVRQVIHHLADSHINAYVRFRLALTEQAPLIKPYNEKAWAELADARSAPIDLSLSLLDSIHGRWVVLLRSMKEEDFSRIYRHPESGDFPLETVLALYSWHCGHHLAHVTALKQRMGW